MALLAAVWVSAIAVYQPIDLSTIDLFFVFLLLWVNLKSRQRYVNIVNKAQTRWYPLLSMEIM